MGAHDPTLMIATKVAKAMLSGGVEVEPLQAGGRNSRIYSVRNDGRSFALKQYPLPDGDLRDRLATEVGALRLMHAHGVDVVPHVVAVDREHNFVLLSWVAGELVTNPTDADIDAATAFLAIMHSLRHAPEACRQPLAAEACLSASEVERQIRSRLLRLSEVPLEELSFHQFLREEFMAVFTRCVHDVHMQMDVKNLAFSTELPHERRSLVPADFGFHNSLRRSDGSLVFLDFEYFGWDDPVKLTADVLWHPGVVLSSALRRRFRGAAQRLYEQDPQFSERLEALLPLFGLRWVLILLNEFVPERWHRRVLAGASEQWVEAKELQLAKARALLAQLA